MLSDEVHSAEFFSLAGQQITHLQQHHGEAFQTLIGFSVKYQSVVAGYLLNPVPTIAGLDLKRVASLEDQRAAVKAELSLAW